MLPLEPSQEKQKLQLKLVPTGNVFYIKQTLLKNHNNRRFLWKIVKTEEGGISLIQPGL